MPVGFASGSSRPHVAFPKRNQYTRKFQTTPAATITASQSTALSRALARGGRGRRGGLELPRVLVPFRERHLGPFAAAGEAYGDRLPRRALRSRGGVHHRAQRVAAPDAAPGAATRCARW